MAKAEASERRRRDAKATGRIRQVHDESDRLRLPRVDAVLKREGVHVGRRRVERLIRQAGLARISPARTRACFTRRAPNTAPAPHSVQPDFTTPRPIRRWATDLTMVPTGEGPLWLSAIRAALSRRIAP
ncbi:IS3 family transposase [Streptomyces sp. NPDC002276]